MPEQSAKPLRPERPLRSITRLFWVFLTGLVGLIPSVLFFVWIERNMALPMPCRDFLGELLGGHKLIWPWIMLWDYPTWVRIAWDFGLFFAFGFIHTLLAQRPVQSALRTILPAQCIRAFYLCLTGITAFLMMAYWQNTGMILWRIPAISSSSISIISIVIFYPLLLAAFRVMAFFDVLEFIGLRQLYCLPHEIDSMSAGGKLLDRGFYARVRHPMYFFTLSAFLLAPMMSLDRLVLFTASVIYLFFAIPVEERKLEARFGEDYRQYRLRVPAVIPFFRARGSA